MTKLRTLHSKLVRDTRGANMVEYILLVGVVALISIAAFKLFGQNIRHKVGEQGTTVSGINASPGQLALVPESGAPGRRHHDGSGASSFVDSSLWKERAASTV